MRKKIKSGRISETRKRWLKNYIKKKVKIKRKAMTRFPRDEVFEAAKRKGKKK